MNRHPLLPLLLLPLALTAEAAEPDGTLTADGRSSATYTLIRSRGYEVEAPDSSRQHATAHFQHIQQTWDGDLGAYVFQFFSHALIDDDRGLANVGDRQRTELKTYNHSPAFMVAQEGDSVVMTWKFRLPEGMLTTSRFTHIHQLKGIDNSAGTADVSSPLVTFTCCTVGSSRQELQVRWQDRTNGNKSTYLARASLAPLLGQWLEAEERVRYGADGCYSLTIRNVKTGEVVVDVAPRRLDMWRTGCAGLRPKWGIYRYIGTDRSLESQLRDEELRFADFAISPVTATGIEEATAPAAPRKGVYTLQGVRMGHKTQLRKGVYIIDGRKAIIR